MLRTHGPIKQSITRLARSVGWSNETDKTECLLSSKLIDGLLILNCPVGLTGSKVLTWMLLQLSAKTTLLVLILYQILLSDVEITN